VVYGEAFEVIGFQHERTEANPGYFPGCPGGTGQYVNPLHSDD